MKRVAVALVTVIAAGLAARLGLLWVINRGFHPPPPESLAKIDKLRTILKSKNDNDARLDSLFNDLTDDDRRLLRKEYVEWPPESRNERGTIVFVLGRKLKDPADWAFLREVVSEPRCLSLDDCKKALGGAGPGDDVTLAYPALVALKQAERVLDSDSNNKDARSVLDAARKSDAPALKRAVGRLDHKLSARH